MSKSDDSPLNDLAAQYMDLWQKQLSAMGSDRAVKESIELAQPFQEGAAEMMKNLDNPEKIQDWMTTWAETWKAQFSDGTTQPFDFSSFAPNTQQNGAASTGDPSSSAEHDVDDLTRRIALLEERVQQLESKLKG